MSARDTDATRAASPGHRPPPWANLPRLAHDGGLAFHATGTGQPVVLVHGVGLRCEAWAAQIADLATDHAVLAVDMPGLGESPRLQRAQPVLADFTDAIAAWMQATIGGPAVVAGHSMGGMVTLDLATRWPQLCLGVAPCNAVYRRSDSASRAVRERAAALAAGDADATAPVVRWFGSDPRGELADCASACRAWLESNDHAGYSAAYTAFAHHDAPPDDALATLACPALFLTGALDPNSTAAMSRAMTDLVPDGRCVVLDDANHMAPMTHPDAVSAALRRFARHCQHEATRS